MKKYALAIVLILALISTSILGCDNNDKEDELEKQIEALSLQISALQADYDSLTSTSEEEKEALSSELSETHKLLLASLGIEEITLESIEVAIPGSVTDDEDRTVTIDEIPERILSLAPNCTEILYSLGLGDKVVGRTDYCDYPEEVQDKPSVGSAWPGFVLEEILVLEPDLVLSVPGDIVSDLEGEGLTVIVTKAETINDILQNIALIGGVTGKAEEAATLIDEMEQDLVEVVSKTGLAAERPTVFYEVDASLDEDKPWTTGGDTFQNDLIRLAGGRNIAASRSGWYQMSIEEILDADPTVIILEDYQFGVSPEDVAARSNWTGITAVTEDNIFPIIDPNLTCRQGPRVIEGLEVIAEIIHPELFK